MRFDRSKSKTPCGFTLIEVTIAIAVAAIGLLSILGAYASIHKQSGDSGVRTDAVFAVNSLRNYLQWERGFTEVYNEIQGETFELVIFTYRGDLPDQPNSLSQNVYCFVDHPDGEWQEYEPAREGQMFLARLSFDENTNPVLGSELPESFVDYPHSWIAVEVSLFDVYGSAPVENLPQSRRPKLSTTLIVNR